VKFCSSDRHGRWRLSRLPNSPERTGASSSSPVRKAYRRPSDAPPPLPALPASSFARPPCIRLATSSCSIRILYGRSARRALLRQWPRSSTSGDQTFSPPLHRGRVGAAGVIRGRQHGVVREPHQLRFAGLPGAILQVIGYHSISAAGWIVPPGRCSGVASGRSISASRCSVAPGHCAGVASRYSGLAASCSVSPGRRFVSSGGCSIAAAGRSVLPASRSVPAGRCFVLSSRCSVVTGGCSIPAWG
jgi:hypothetical protein